MSNLNWFYDKESGRYIVKNARIWFNNFEGVEQDYNLAGKRNFRLELDEDLAQDLIGQGVNVRVRPARNEDEDDQRLLKIGVYSDADIRFLSGKAMTKVVIDNKEPRNDQGALVDAEFRKGHVKNGNIALEFHISKNTKVMSSAPYARVDTMIIPIRKSRLLDDYEDIETDVFGED